MLPGRERLHRCGNVKRIRNSNDHGVNGVIRRHLVVVRVDLLGVVKRPEPLGQRFVGITDSLQGDIASLLRRFKMSKLGNRSAPKDSDPEGSVEKTVE